MGKQPGLYVNHERRMLTGREALWLQGFGEARDGFSEQQTKRLAGNSMQVDVLGHLLARVLPALGTPCDPPPPLPKNVG